MDRLIFEQTLSSEKAQWNDKDFSHYQITFDLSIPLILLTSRFQIEVKSGEIVEALWEPLIDLHNPQFDSNEVSFEPMTYTQIDNFLQKYSSLEAMYQFAQDVLNNKSSNCLGYNFSFDPNFHYINEAVQVCECCIADCGTYYKVISFELLPIQE